MGERTDWEGNDGWTTEEPTSHRSDEELDKDNDPEDPYQRTRKTWKSNSN